MSKSKGKSGEELEKLEHELGGVMNEFKAFILKGNIIDMAVGVIIGGAFSTIVSSLVGDILMPILGALTGGADFTSFKYVISTGAAEGEEAAIMYGNFLQSIFNFLIIGLCMFFMIKAIAMVTSKLHHEEAKAAEKPAGPTSEELLAEIRDLLKSQEGITAAQAVVAGNAAGTAEAAATQEAAAKS